MTKKKPTLGEGVAIDVDKLVESRLLIQANSGAGKSYTLRRLLEQTHGLCQHIVLDIEGEFHTLRENHEYVLAGKGGDCPADLKSAALLARRLLELNVSAIIDIYELGSRRPEFVAAFLTSLVQSPRELWHPALIVVDEAHMFCPESGHGKKQTVSSGPVIDLMTLGRKRGFAGVLATQRIAKLHKDAAAEALNKLIGRSSLDVDMKRAADELGMTSRDEMHGLRKLAPGEFFAFGPAISTEVVRFKVGKVQTTHPKAGQRAMAPTPPSAHIRKVLGELADLPKEAEEEARSVSDLRAKVRELERELRTTRASTKVETNTIEVPVLGKTDVAQLTKLADKMFEFGDRQNAAMQTLVQHVSGLASKLARATSSPAPSPARAAPRAAAPRAAAPKPKMDKFVHSPKLTNGQGSFPDGTLTQPQNELMAALSWWKALGHDTPTKAQVAAKAGWKVTGSHLRQRLAELHRHGFIEYPSPKKIRLTDLGATMAPKADVSVTLIDSIRDSLSEPQRVIFDALRDTDVVHRDDLATRIGWEASGSHLRQRLAELAARQIIEYPEKKMVTLQDWVTE